MPRIGISSPGGAAGGSVAGSVVVSDTRPANPAVGLVRIGKAYVPPLPPLPVTAGLVADYDAENIAGADNSVVTAWPETVGNFPLNAVTGAPTLRHGILNGKKVVAFAGAGADFLTSGAVTAPSPNTEFYVARMRDLAGGDLIIPTSGAHHFVPSGAGSSATWNFYATYINASTKLVVADEWIIAAVTYGGDNVGRIRVNRTDRIVGVGDSPRTGLRVGGGKSEVARVVIYNRALTLTEIQQTEASLASLYGITLPA